MSKKEGKITGDTSLAFRYLEFPVVLDYLVSVCESIWFQVSCCALFAGLIYFCFLCICDCVWEFSCVMFTWWSQLKKLKPGYESWKQISVNLIVSILKKKQPKDQTLGLKSRTVRYVKMFSFQLQRNGIYPHPDNALNSQNWTLWSF